MKYCNKCGKPLDPKEKFCSGCGNKIQEVKKETVKATKELTNTEIDEANKLGYISLGLYFALPLVGWIFNFFLSIFSALFPPLAILSLFSLLTYLGKPAGIVTMVIMRIKYPTSTFGKVLMWVYIGLAIFGLLVFIFIIIVWMFVFYCLMTLYN